ncbi:MAG: AMP-binding protein [Pseudomonadota bacterium]
MQSAGVPIESLGQNAAATLTANVAPFVSVLDELERCARELGDLPAYRFVPDSVRGVDLSEANVWTWREVSLRARAAADEMVEAGLSPGDRVVLTYPSGLDFIVALLGCFYARVIAVPVSAPRKGDTERWIEIIRNSGAWGAFVAPSVHSKLNELSRARDLGPCLMLAASDPTNTLTDKPAATLPSLTQNDIAFLQYTSGSTGLPKGVIVTHLMIQVNVAQIAEGFGYRPGDQLLSWLPNYHDMGLITSVLLPIRMRFETTLLSPAAFLRDPTRFLELVGLLRVSGFGGPNFAYEHCVQRVSADAIERIDLSSLRVAFCGAEIIRSETLARFARMFEPSGFRPQLYVGCYGMAEATLCLTSSPLGSGVNELGVKEEALSRNRLETGEDRTLVESGIPARGVEVAIVRKNDARPLPDNEIGEIWVRGPNISPGYWSNPTATRDVFDQALDGQSGWMRTGDLGALRDGHLYVTGREKELIVSRGRNMYPQDIEATVAGSHPHVMPERVAAFPLSDRDDSGYGLACELERRASRNPQTDEILSSIRSALVEQYDVSPSSIVLVGPGGLPVTPSGKLQRLACRRDLDAVIARWQDTDSPILPSRTPRGSLAEHLKPLPKPLQRKALMEHLRKKLRQAIGEDETLSESQKFFELGLDSAKGMALVASLEHDLGIEIDETVLYEYPDLASLCDYLLGAIESALSYQASDRRSAQAEEIHGDPVSPKAALTGDPDP